MGMKTAASLSLLALVAAGASAQAPRIDAPALYAKHCQNCHGERGVSSDAEMGFTSRTWKHGTTSAAIGKVIAAGVPDTDMQGWADRLSAREIQALSTLVRSFDTRLPPEKRGGGR
jgi:mono/diheme cytochrome c family protein